MTVSPFSAREAARIREALAGLVAGYGLDVERIAALVGAPEGTLQRLMQGLASPDESLAGRIDAFAFTMALNSLQAWKARVSAGSGYEMLIDRTLTVIGVTGANAALGRRRTQGVLDPSLFLGHKYNALLPSLDCTLIETHGSGIDDLVPLGFFEGRIRCVRFCAEINVGPVTRNGVHEIWPVETADEGIVGHAALHERNEMPRVLTAPGIHVHWREVVRA